MDRIPGTDSVPEAVLTGSLRDFRGPEGADLIDRVGGFFAWQNLRRQHGMWPYARSTATAHATPPPSDLP